MTASSQTDRQAAAGATAEPGRSATPAESYYALLGLPVTATSAEITRAYRAAMKRVHPDRQRADRRAAAEDSAKALNRAYATLSKPLARQAYDRSIRAQTFQDEVMHRYVGGFYVPSANGQHPMPADRHLRRDPTEAERREQREADRGALLGMMLVFGSVTAGVVLLLLLWAVARALLGAAI
ncbi:MAG: J domain-containing protein [Chloroflexota bacterium]|nr:J domain-containing protein [Chloroflexota bacterium]